MTATLTNRPDKAPLPYSSTAAGYAPMQTTRPQPSTTLFMDESVVNGASTPWDDHRDGSLSDCSLSDDEEGDPFTNFKPDHSLYMPTIDVLSSNAQSLPSGHSKGSFIKGAQFMLSFILWALNALRSFLILVSRDYPFLLSIASPAITKAITVPALCSMNPIASTYLCPSDDANHAEVLKAVDKNPSEVGNVIWADFSSLAEVQKTLADYFVGDGPGASELAIKIAKAELATSDLVIAVRYSTLRTAEELADSLSIFVKDAGEVGDGLQELDAKAMGAIDSIINLNIWALKTIEEAQAPAGVLSALAIWRSQKSTMEIINDNFNEAMRAQDRILSNLITQAKLSQGQLKRMKERLQAIRDLATRENVHIGAEHNELLGSMWTRFGSNRQDLHRYQTNLELLGNLEEYTDVAKAHIAQALTNLKTMQAQMKDLREKVSQPDITGAPIPVDVHIRTIMDGIKRLKEGRIRARERESDIRTIGT